MEQRNKGHSQLPNEYWIKNPWPNTHWSDTSEFKELIQKANIKGQYGGYNYYHIKDNSWVTDAHEKPEDGIPEVSYTDWKAAIVGESEYSILDDYSIDAVKRKKIVVHCPTPNEWDRVTAIIGKPEGNTEGWNYAGQKTGLSIKDNGKTEFGTIGYGYKEPEWQIIPASIFLTHNEKKEEKWVPKVGEWVHGKEECLPYNAVKILEIEDDTVWYDNKGRTSNMIEYLRPATQSEIYQVCPPVAETRKLLSFKTEDGYDLYDGDTVQWVRTDNDSPYLTSPAPITTAHRMNEVTPYWKLFHSKENAEKWIKEENKKLQKPYQVGQYVTIHEKKTRLIVDINPVDGWLCLDNEMYSSGYKGYNTYNPNQPNLRMATTEEIRKAYPIPEPWSIVTTDGVRVYEGDKVWWLDIDGKNHNLSESPINKSYENSITAGYKVFSTYEAAEKYRQKQCEPEKPKYPEYKVGQKVLVHSGANVGTHHNGKIGIIEEIDETSSYQPNIGVKFDDGWTWCYPQNNNPFNVEILEDEKVEYKVGDWVVMLSNCYDGKMEGEVHQLTGHDGRHWYIKGTSRYPNSNCYLEESNIRHAKTHEIPVQPIGWKVGETWIYKAGTRPYTIQKGTESEYKVVWVDDEGRTKENDLYSTENINERVACGDWIPYNPPIEEKKEQVPERKWKIGDRFRSKYNGKVYTIEENRTDGEYVINCEEEGVESEWYSPDEIDELFSTNAWIPYNPDPISVNREPQVGDRVRCLNVGSWGSIKVGDIGTVTALCGENWDVLWDSRGSEIALDMHPSQIEVITNNQINNNQVTNTKNNQNEKSKSTNKEDSIYKGNCISEWQEETIISGSYSKGKAVSVSQYAENISRGQGSVGYPVYSRGC